MNIDCMREIRAGQFQDLMDAVEQYRSALRQQAEQAVSRRLELVQEACLSDLESDTAGLRALSRELQETETDRLDALKRLEKVSAILLELPAQEAAA